MQFRSVALGIIAECTTRDYKRTKRLLQAQYGSAGWLTLADMAYMLRDAKVTSTKIFVEITRARWFGDVDPSNSILKFIIAVVCPFYLFAFNGDRVNDRRRHHAGSGATPSNELSADVDLLQTRDPQWSVRSSVQQVWGIILNQVFDKS